MSQPRTVLIYCNHVTGGWSPVNRAMLNGSEEAVVQLAEIWASWGHQVQVYQNGFEGEHQGVQYKPRWTDFPENLDILILFKTLENLDKKAAIKIYWTIDLPLPSGATYLSPRNAEKLDAVLCVTDWHRDKVIEACPWADPRKIYSFWLGVDKKEIESVQDIPKVPGRCVYASSLDRGAHPLLDIWGRIKEQVPQAELHVLYGWDFWIRSEAIVREDVRQTMMRERSLMQQKLKQPGVVFIGRPETRERYLKEMREAEAWLYPCLGGELCCKVALEAQALETVPVVWPTMALSETVDKAFHIPQEQDFQGFIDRVVQVLTAPEPWQTTVKDVAQDLPTWDDLAEYVWHDIVEQVQKVEEIEYNPFPAQVDKFVIPSASPKMKDYKLDLIFAVPGMPFTGATDQQENLGGSETIGLQVARELAARGHRVTMFCNFPEKAKPDKFQGVSYLPLTDIGRYLGSYVVDGYVAQRDPMLLNIAHKARVSAFWTHDLALMRAHGAIRGSSWNVDYHVPVSHWHGNQFREVYNFMDPQYIVPMQNGIDIDLVKGSLPRKPRRDRNALVYAARPERGLDLLLEKVFPRLLERNPKLVLYVAGYNNTVPEMQDYYNYCFTRIKQYGPRAQWVGHLKKPDLYSLYAKSRAYLYPTKGFSEVSCITAMECAACGLPFVASDIGALSETTGLCPGFADLVPHPGDPTEKYVEEFIERAWQVITDDELNLKMSDAGIKGSDVYSVEKVAAEWEDFLLGAMEQRSNNVARTALGMWRRGDTYGAKALLPEAGMTDAPKIPQLQLASKHLVPDIPTEIPPSAYPSIVESLAKIFANQPAKPRKVRGWGNESKKIAQAVANGLPGITYAEDGLVDILIVHEMLDCHPDPEACIAELESQVYPGGWLFALTAGPSVIEHRNAKPGTDRWAPVGRWLFDHHDLRELLDGKPGFSYFVLGGNTLSDYDATPLSWTLTQWQPGKAKRGSLDWTRRKLLQSPQLSLSVCMIGKNAENLLHRCLKSVVPVCDEIILGNDSSTDDTQAIAEKYGVEVFPIPSPLSIGFGEARNLTLERATGDLVLWIDGDEELLDLCMFPKYLRWNCFQGYGIRQHHFSAVPENAFKPDMPIRLFRRVGLDGKLTGIKFYGVVHEHPEIRMNHSVGESIVVSDLHLAHDGYLTERARRKRFDRNLRLMLKDRYENPTRMLGKFLMMRDWIHKARQIVEQEGPRVTPEIVEYCEAAIQIFRQDFMGKTHLMGIDGLAYYNEALRHMQRGYDVQVAIKLAVGGGATVDIAYTGRVDSKDDLLKIVNQNIEEYTSRTWTGKYL